MPTDDPTGRSVNAGQGSKRPFRPGGWGRRFGDAQPAGCVFRAGWL